MKVKVCEICGAETSDAFYKEKETGKIICEECLLLSDKIERETVTHYYLDGEYVGDSDHIEEVIDAICDTYDYTQI